MTETKMRHEVRDPIHGFIFFDNREKALINSQPFQRLKHIHQLAMTYQVYPGASHKRFEHSLGVMETASRFFQTITDERLIVDNVRPHIKEELTRERCDYWQRVVRVAALVHDIGHLPFSHAGEGVLPDGTDHETLGEQMVGECSEISDVLGISPPINAEDVVNVAFEHRRKKGGLNPWVTLLNEMITGDYGADRIDYLLRDSHHLGVAYGRFDADRLIDNLRVALDEEEKLTLAVERGGLHAAEGLLLARYWMFTQVYYHPVRIAYDFHLGQFLKSVLPSGTLRSSWQQVLEWDDTRVLRLMQEHSKGEDELSGYAKRLMLREHFKKVYELKPQDKIGEPKILEKLYASLVEEFGQGGVFKYPGRLPREAEPTDFWVVRERSGEVSSARTESKVIERTPDIEIGYILASPDVREKCEGKIQNLLQSLLKEGEGK